MEDIVKNPEQEPKPPGLSSNFSNMLNEYLPKRKKHKKKFNAWDALGAKK